MAVLLTGPNGPRLAEPSFPAVLARRFYWGLATDQGMWCEGYQDGSPIGAPTLLRGKWRYGLVSIADLDPAYFTGLPFTPQDEAKIPRGRQTTQYDAIKTWIAPDQVTVRWHAADDILGDAAPSSEVIAGLLSD